MRNLSSVPGLGLSCAVMAAVSVCALPAKAAMGDAEAFRWANFYYQDPQPDRVPEALAYLRSRQVLNPERHHAEVVSGLFAGIFEHNPERMAGWLSDLSSFTDDEQKYLLEAVWIADLPQSRAILEQVGSAKLTRMFGQDIGKTAPPKLADLSVDAPSKLDLAWGHFFATGDESDIRHIIGALDHMADTRKGANGVATPAVKAARQAARSLTANALTHPRVLDLLRQDLAQTHGRNYALASLIDVIDEEKKTAGAAKTDPSADPVPPVVNF